MDNLFERQLYHSDSEHSRLVLAQTICMVAAGSFAIMTLCQWFFPSVDLILPNKWFLMKPNTALCILSGAIAILLIQKKKSVIAIRLCGFLIIFLVTVFLSLYASGPSFPFDTYLMQNKLIAFHGTMSPHAMAFFGILGFSFLVVKKDNNQNNNLRDIFTLTLIGIVLIVFSSFFFSATSLSSQAIAIHVDVQTFIAMCMLTFGNFVRCIHGGIFSPFMGYGISSYTAKTTLPWALLGPFVVISAIDYISVTFGISQQDQIAVSAVLLSLMLFFIILWVTNRISHLENDLRKLALTDEMTGLYNHRAFCILGKHAFLESLRNDTYLVVLYFDLDGLKKINDTLGHQVGSEMIIEFTNLLKANFRRNETIARIGGDECVVLSKKNEIEVALKRLADATKAANNKKGKLYTISYSHGKVAGKAKDYQSIDDLIKDADELMYQNKSKKKQNI